MKLVEKGKPIDMTFEMADKFVDEAMMVMHASQFGGDNRPPISYCSRFSVCIYQ